MVGRVNPVHRLMVARVLLVILSMPVAPLVWFMFYGLSIYPLVSLTTGTLHAYGFTLIAALPISELYHFPLPHGR